MPNNPDIKETGRMQHIAEDNPNERDDNPTRSYDQILNASEGDSVHRGRQEPRNDADQDHRNYDPGQEILPTDTKLDPSLTDSPSKPKQSR